jgi:hypothetical protein
MINIEVMTSPATAARLTAELGPILDWHSFLSGSRRNERTCHRLVKETLKPTARVYRDGDAVARPMYSVKDVEKFIQQFKTRTGPELMESGIMTIAVDSTDMRPWQVIKVHPSTH